MAVKQFTELLAWQRAMDLAEAVYIATAAFPNEEQFGLTNQLRRAAVSVPSNVAEGQGRRSSGEFLYFLSVARGSLQETQTQILLAGRLSYLKPQEVNDLMALATQVGKLINGLGNALARNNSG